MYVMNFTTAIEILMFAIQCIILVDNIQNANVLCETNQILPTLNIQSCSGLLWLIYSANGAFIVLYMYFCCVTYEHYWMGLRNPKFVMQEAKRIAREKRDAEALEQAVLLAEKEKRAKYEALMNEQVEERVGGDATYAPTPTSAPVQDPRSSMQSQRSKSTHRDDIGEGE
jgi:hypothetical protein